MADNLIMRYITNKNIDLRKNAAVRGKVIIKPMRKKTKIWRAFAKIEENSNKCPFCMT